MTMHKIPPTPSESENKPKPRRRFLLLDPLAIDKALLYRDSSGRHKIGLILETERGPDGQFSVTQATPGRLLRKGLKGKVVGNWHVLGKKWDSKSSKAAEQAALP